jgi:hypothetical protein
MKKFQIEMLFIALGILLVFSIAGKQCWEQVVYATDCTQGCSTDSGACHGTDNLAGCGCDHAVAGKHWSNSPIKGSTMGATPIEFISTTCYTLTPCDKDYKINGYGVYCSGNENCIHPSNGATITSCQLYKQGNPYLVYSPTCLPKQCNEG